MKGLTVIVITVLTILLLPLFATAAVSTPGGGTLRVTENGEVTMLNQYPRARATVTVSGNYRVRRVNGDLVITVVMNDREFSQIDIDVESTVERLGVKP